MFKKARYIPLSLII